MTRVPTQITCRIFKQHPGRWDTGDSPARLGFEVGAGGGRKYSDLLPSVNPEKRFIFIAGTARFCALRSHREGAQYSLQRGAVNAYLVRCEGPGSGGVCTGPGALQRVPFAEAVRKATPRGPLRWGNLHPREAARAKLQDVLCAHGQAQLLVGGLVAIHADRALGDLAVRLGVARDEPGFLQG